jgi:hypothetical protein
MLMDKIDVRSLDDFALGLISTFCDLAADDDGHGLVKQFSRCFRLILIRRRATFHNDLAPQAFDFNLAGIESDDLELAVRVFHGLANVFWSTKNHRAHKFCKALASAIYSFDEELASGHA